MRLQLVKFALINPAKDFSFIVNGKEFKTSRIISDLLSPTLCYIHLIDPTIDTFIINTKQNGDFSSILNLTDFNEKQLSTNEIPFFSEVIEQLNNESIEIEEQNKKIEMFEYHSSEIVQLMHQSF